MRSRIFITFVCLAGLLVQAKAGISVQLRSEDSMSLEGLQVWLLVESDKPDADYTAKSFYPKMKARYSDANGQVVAEELDVGDNQILRIVIYDPRVEWVDMTLKEPGSSPIPVQLKSRPLNGSLALDFSAIPEEHGWKKRWEKSQPHQWLISLRLKDQDGITYQHIAHIRNERLELYGLPDGTYTLELMSFSKFRAGGDGFLYPVDDGAQTLRIEKGKLTSPTSLKLRMMRQ